MTLNDQQGARAGPAMVKQAEAGVEALRGSGSGTNLASLEDGSTQRVCVNINVAKHRISVDMDVASVTVKAEEPSQKILRESGTAALDAFAVHEPMGRATPENSNDHRAPRISRCFIEEAQLQSPRTSFDAEESTRAQGGESSEDDDLSAATAAAAVVQQQQHQEAAEEEGGIRRGETTNAVASTAAANLEGTAAQNAAAATAVRESTRAKRQSRRPAKLSRPSSANASVSQSSADTTAAVVKSDEKPAAVKLPSPISTTPAAAATAKPKLATLNFSPGAAADILVSMFFGAGFDDDDTAATPETTKKPKHAAPVQPRKRASSTKAPKDAGGAKKDGHGAAAAAPGPAPPTAKGAKSRRGSKRAAADTAAATAAAKKSRMGLGAAAAPSQDGLSQLVEAGLLKSADAPGVGRQPPETALVSFSNPPAPAPALAALAGAEAAGEENADYDDEGYPMLSVSAAAAAAKRRLLPSRGGGRQKVHRPWSLPEVEALVEGVAHYGRGQWADIKSLEQHGVSHMLASRSAVDLKDKWRNLLRIAMLPVLYKRREAAEIPPAMLARVRELAAHKGSPRRGIREGSAADGCVPKGARRSKHHSPWTLAESQALVDGVAECGGCRWTVIKKLGTAAIERRTAMDLKDKWRNLLQLANLPSQSRRKQETPPELLQRVLELEARFGVARRKGRKAGAAADGDYDMYADGANDDDAAGEEDDLAPHEELNLPLPAGAPAEVAA